MERLGLAFEVAPHPLGEGPHGGELRELALRRQRGLGLVEQTIADVWQDILGIQQVGIQDNFFELGGHSLLATQIIHRINQTFEIDLPMRVMFDDPTIAALSLLIEEALIERLEAIPN